MKVLSLVLLIHQAPAGWKPTRWLAAPTTTAARWLRKSIGEVPDGYLVRTTGELLHYGDKRLRPSPDGDFHWCSAAGSNTGRTICLFVPPRGM
jgi:hypothetical protein